MIKDDEMILSVIEFGAFYNYLHRKGILTFCLTKEERFIFKYKGIRFQ